MAATVPKKVTDAVAALHDVVSSIEGHLLELWDFRKELDGELQPLESARLNLALSESATILFCMYLKTRGVGDNANPVKKELERLQLYKTKVSKVADKQKGPKAPTVSLNVSAANRFIDHAIPDLSTEQRQRLQRKAADWKSKGEQQGPSKRQRPSAAESAKLFLEKAKAELEGKVLESRRIA
ncbi:exosome complex protein LRP1 [Klebsormidium nitens]|uniref:Nuclear nucleic acid-binding protein C1D n=1 Tax=Klebsormidium nitens TaxID=105231 RepID=A0A1Y1HT97_KLENI|nr:exosome complex protein LRP1 [Klebsormidium nitens]|eukprot:GAQ79767.1 exosome complex protein LRP1 [Klebsormidium nitens]